MDNNKIFEKTKMKIAISQIKNEEKKVMNKKEKFVFKNIGRSEVLEKV